MMRRLLTAGFAVTLTALAACVGGGAEPKDLNPQPLPPRQEEDKAPPGEPTAGGSSGSSSSGATPNMNADAGPDGDADGGDQ